VKKSCFFFFSTACRNEPFSKEKTEKKKAIGQGGQRRKQKKIRLNGGDPLGGQPFIRNFFGRFCAGLGHPRLAALFDVLLKKAQGGGRPFIRGRINMT